ncbi:hypothetical protein FJY90_08350, partial [Candidatus Gottesmanbacteria bacterium]|nr:hypothetical protein [Candidatus Gottesmanbacteria bacterium]
MLFLIDYLDWHYREIWPKIILLWQNLTLFPFYYFSIPYHCRNLFAPWKRQQIKAKAGFDPGNFLSVASFNLTSRLIAATVRSITIFYGAVFMLTFFFLSAIAVIIWALVPIFTLPLYLILVLEKAKKLEVQQLTKKAGDL